MPSHYMFAGDQAEGLRQIQTSKLVKVVAVSGGKGGVGKSSVSVNLAVTLAQLGKEVLLFDGDLGLANIDIMLGLHAKRSLSDVLSGACGLNDIVIDGPSSVKVIPGASGVEKMASLSVREHAGLVDSFNELSLNADYMFVDTAAGVSDTVLSLTRSAQELLLVVCDEPTSLTDAYALIKIMHRRYGVSNFKILANQTHSPQEGRLLFNKLTRVTDQFLDVNLLYVGEVPFDEMLRQSIRLQKPVVSHYPEAVSSKAFRQIAAQILRWPHETLMSGNTGFFLHRTTNIE